MNKLNPFFYGDPIPVAQFIGRRSEIRRVANRICSSGSSTAIIGEPRAGKSSIFKYLKSEENKKALYGDWAERLFFVEIDFQNLERNASMNQVWELILDRLKGDLSSLPNVYEAYQSCRLNNWAAFSLEKFFGELNASNRRLVLMFDEFSSIVEYPGLHTADFYGRLRSLSTRFESFVLLLASRYPLDKLHEQTLSINRNGSPFFNFIAPLMLKPFSKDEIDILLKLSGRRFTKQEKILLEELSGGHPYLLQVAACSLWEAYTDKEKDKDLRHKRVCDDLYREAADTLSTSWYLWSPKTRIAFMSIALDEIPLLARSHSFDIVTITKQLDDFEPEVRFLADQGYISIDKQLAGGWQVRIKAFLWWLAAELRRVIRKEEDFEKWLADQEWNGLLTRGEKEILKDAIQKATPLLQEVTKAFLKKGS